MKNERLMDVLSTVSPAYVAEAAPGNIPRRTGKSPRIVKRLLAVAAVLVLLVAAAVATIGISAEEEQPLQEMPVILLREDFDRLIVQRAEKIEGLVSTHELARLQAMYEHQYLSEAINEKHRKAMLERYPIVALADIRNLDETISDVETENYLEILRSIGFTQNDLIECYERMYELVENSDVENKEEILASLPEIPERPGEQE
jgi:hypothetical protein